MNISDVLAWIDKCYEFACERPQMYLRTPQAMEDRFIDLELLREYIINDVPGRLIAADLGYFKFLEYKSPQRSRSFRFCDNNNSGEATFEDFASFWKEYLQSDFRKQTE